MLRHALLLVVALQTATALSQAAPEEGFVSLFDGRTLTGWTIDGKPDGFEVRDGCIYSESPSGGLWLRTVESYGNFDLRFDYLLSTVGNSGVMVHSTAYEVQLLAPWTPRRDDLHCTGSLYGHVAVQHRPEEEGLVWRTMRIVCLNKRTTVYVDDGLVLTADLTQVPSLANAPHWGTIAFQDAHSSRGEWVKFRNVRIRDLDRDPALVGGNLASDNAPLRYAAIQAAGRLGAPVLAEAVNQTLNPDPVLAEAARAALESMAGQATARPADRLALEAALLALDPVLWASSGRLIGDLLGRVGSDQAVPLLADRLRSTQTWADALAALRQIPGQTATAALAKALEEAPEEAVPALLVALAGRPGNHTATLAGYLSWGQEAVRLAALEALATAADPAAAGAVLALLEQAQGPLRESGLATLARLAAAAETAEPSTAAGWYRRVLTDSTRRGPRSAALVGLARLGAVAPAELLALTRDDAQLAAAAVQALLLQRDPALVETALGLLAAGTGAEREILLRWLLGVDRERGLGQSTADAAQLDQPEVAVPALLLLAERAELAALPLFEAAARLPAGPLAEAGRTGLLALAEPLLAAGRRDEAAAIYRQLLPQATGRLQRPVLTGAASLGLPEAVEPVRAALATGLRRDVGPVAVELARQLAGNDPESARALLLTVLEQRPEPWLRAAVVAQIRQLGVDLDMAADAGFVTRWWLLGPLPNPGARGGYEVAYAPEAGVDLAAPLTDGDKQLAWRHHHEVASEQGIVELAELIRPNTNVLCYAYAELTSDREQPAVLRLGTDDGFALWLNGERLAGNPAPRALTVGQDAVPVTLREGANQVLVKVLNGGSRWALSLQVTTPDGQPLVLPQRRGE